MARLSGQTDVGIAAVVSGRRYPQLIPVVGPFVDTVVLRARVEPGMPFAGLLDRCATSTSRRWTAPRPRSRTCSGRPDCRHPRWRSLSRTSRSPRCTWVI
ncbi:hypothetical protein GS444_14530 [Rhodococcus hoagii]|nr:hypothetical protein [Prescottella equi]